jgi:uncharacterized surface protein with fasciclin (FAS1) repeats
VVFNQQQEEFTMTSQTQRIQRVVVSGVCALALAAIAGAVNAQHCVKKSQGQGYMVPMHPHHMHGYHSHIKRHGYQAPAYRQGANGKTGKGGTDQSTRTSSSTAQSRGLEPDIIETATTAGNFNTLIKAAVAADLYDTLRGEGPFTLFAPTDDAFASLPDGMLDELLADKDMLVAVLSYHVVPGRLTAADLLVQREFKTVQGQTLSIGALNVVSADIETGNGIVHVIDNVVVPSL